MIKTHKIILGLAIVALVSLTATFAFNSINGGGNSKAVSSGACTKSCCAEKTAQVLRDAAAENCECCDVCKTGTGACEGTNCCDCNEPAVTTCCCGDVCNCCDGCKTGNCTCEDCNCCCCCKK